MEDELLFWLTEMCELAFCYYDSVPKKNNQEDKFVLTQLLMFQSFDLVVSRLVGQGIMGGKHGVESCSPQGGQEAESTKVGRIGG